MPSATSEDGFVGAWFEVEFGTHLTGAFMECKGFGSSSNVVEMMQNNAKGHRINAKIPGILTWTDITLTRGLTDSKEIWDWFKMVHEGKMKEARQNGTITMINHEGTAVAKFEFVNAWPSGLTGPSFNSTSNDHGVEEVTITHEGYKRSQ